LYFGSQRINFLVMPDAPLEWKIAYLKEIQEKFPGVACIEGKTPRQDLIWVQDLESDGYISAKFRMGYRGESKDKVEWAVPNMIWDIHVLEKGRQLIAMESKENMAVAMNEVHGQSLPHKYWYERPFGIVLLAAIAIIFGSIAFGLIVHYLPNIFR
jgi:hypothetical protein